MVFVDFASVFGSLPHNQWLEAFDLLKCRFLPMVVLAASHERHPPSLIRQLLPCYKSERFTKTVLLQNE